MDAATQPIPITSGSALSGMLSAAVEISAQPEPEVAGPDLAGPELAGPDLAEPDLAGPGLAAGPEPEVAEPEVAEPEVAGPEFEAGPRLAAGPDLAGPEFDAGPRLAAGPDLAAGPEPEVAEPEFEAGPQQELVKKAPNRVPATGFRPVPESLEQQAIGRKALASRRRRYRMAGMVALVIILCTGSLTYALSKHAAPAPAGGGSADVPGAGRATRNLAAAWTAAQISRTATVACDPVMCRALKAHGLPANALLELWRRTADLLRSDVIVATPALRSQFGSRLSSGYAPAVIASFGSGKQRIEIRVIARHGAAAYMRALSADMRARKQSGAQLLRSNRIVASAAARRQLAAGQVDSRLLITIAGMAALHPVFIVKFGDPAPGASAVSPLRSADLAEANASRRVLNSIYIQSMLAFLRGLNAPLPDYPAASVGHRRLASGLHVIHIEFAAPSPLGLVSPQTP